MANINGAVSLAGMELTPEERDGIRGDLTTALQISKLAPQIQGTFPLNGFSEFLIGEVEARWTGEGAKKVASGSARNVIFRPHKLTAAVVETLEASLTKPEIAEGLIRTAGSAFAKKFDRTVFGLEGAAPNANFGTFAGATVLNVTEYGNFIDAQGEIDADGGAATGILMTTAAYNSLRRLRNSLGAWEYPGLQDKVNPDIDGLPVALIRDTTKAAVLGDFGGHSKWGVAVPETIQVKNAGEITDVTGQVHNLTDENKIATIVETFVGFNFDDVKYFRRLTFTDAPAA